jgi:hypothetical protein
MAFRIPVSLPNKTGGDYFAVTACRWDDLAREASAIISLYADENAARSNPAAPVVPIIAKVRLAGADYEKWLGKAAIKARRESGRSTDYRAIIYEAAMEGVLSDIGDPDPKRPGARALFAKADAA